MRETTFTALYTELKPYAITYVRFILYSRAVDAQRIVDNCRDEIPFEILMDKDDLWLCLRAILRKRCLKEVRLPEDQNPLSCVVRNTTIPEHPPSCRLDMLSHFASTLNFEIHQMLSIKYGLNKNNREIAALLLLPLREVKRRLHWLHERLDAAVEEYGLNLLSLLPGGTPSPYDLAQILYRSPFEQYATYLLGGSKRAAQAIVKSVFDTVRTTKKDVDLQDLAKQVRSACETRIISNEESLNASVGELPQRDNELTKEIHIAALARQAKEGLPARVRAKLTDKMLEQVLHLAILGKKPSQICEHFSNMSEGVLAQLLALLVNAYTDVVETEMRAEINAYLT